MASIYKRAGSEKWQCQFYATDPETGVLSKVRKSTGQTNKKLAQQFADEQERLQEEEEEVVEEVEEEQEEEEQEEEEAVVVAV